MVDLVRPAPAFLLPFVVAVDAVDSNETALVSIDSSRSGILATSDCIVTLDCVDSLVEAFDVLEARDVLPFLAFGLLEGAVDPANTKNGQPGDLEWCSSKGLSLGSHPSSESLQ